MQRILEMKGRGKVFWFSDLDMNTRLTWSGCGNAGKTCSTETQFPWVINGSFCAASLARKLFERKVVGGNNAPGKTSHSPRSWDKGKSKGGSKGRLGQFLLWASVRMALSSRGPSA